MIGRLLQAGGNSRGAGSRDFNTFHVRFFSFLRASPPVSQGAQQLRAARFPIGFRSCYDVMSVVLVVCGFSHWSRVSAIILILSHTFLFVSGSMANISSSAVLDCGPLCIAVHS